MVTFSINWQKVDQNRHVKGKNGAIYYDFVMIQNRRGRDERGDDGIIKQSVSRKERDEGVEMPIIGNFRIFDRSNEGKPPPEPPKKPKPTDVNGQPRNYDHGKDGQNIPF